jgi:hypothetical protein
MSLFRRNLDTKGRLIRGLIAAVLGLAALLTGLVSRIGGIVLGVLCAFVAFEAVRGWCAVRACGLRTKF